MISIYEVQTPDGPNRIIADEAFVEAHYPGAWQYVGPHIDQTPVSYQPLTRAAFTALVSTGLTSAEKLVLRKDEAMELAWLEIGDLGDAIPRDHEYVTNFLTAAIDALLLTSAQSASVLDNWPTA